MHGQSGVTTYLFTDIEGSTRLWDQEPERMRPALARHDVLTREAVEQNRGRIVKTTGDGFHAVFDDPLDALVATLQLQFSLNDPVASAGVPLQVRCGLHAGVDERRDNDFFGPVVNRAARIMGAAHGGQILLSQAVATLVGERLPKGVTLRTLGAVRLRDLANPESIYQVVHPRLREGFPALRSLEATPNNLPQQVTSFIGRETDLAEVKKLLRQTRLLTLLGVGGLGKTRLSLQVAAEVLDDYPEGVWFIELAALNDEGLVQQAIASVLGVKEEAGRPVIDALAKFVAQRRLLIILDNCEHLVRACAEVARAALAVRTWLEDPDVQSRSAAYARRNDLSRPPAFDASSRRIEKRGDVDAIHRAASFRRTCTCGTTIVSSNCGKCSSDRRNMPSLGWHTSCDRARGSPRACAFGRCDCSETGRSFPPTYARGQNCVAAATNAARADRLELRSADWQRARPVAATVGVCGRMDGRRGGGSGRGRRYRAT